MKKSIGAKTIVFPTPVFLVATYDKAGRPDAMAVAWGGICCSTPPCVSVSLREATYTYGNLMERKAFTVNIPSEKYLKQADYCGVVSGRSEDKLSVAGLTAVKSSLVDAPYIEECPCVLECSLLQSVKIGLHTLFIGEIKDVKIDENALDGQGMPDISKLKPFSFNPASRSYYATGDFLSRAFTSGRK